MTCSTGACAAPALYDALERCPADGFKIDACYRGNPPPETACGNPPAAAETLADDAGNSQRYNRLKRLDLISAFGISAIGAACE